MIAVIRMRWLAVVLAGLCVMVLAPGAAGHAAAGRGQAGRDLAVAVLAGSSPPAATGSLTGIGCFSAADCVAVGSTRVFNDTADGHALAEQWNGRTWIPAGSPAVRSLSAVACPGARLCQAVGGGSAERWNGRAWIADKTPAVRGAALTGVACPAATACVAVGARGIRRHAVTLAETWNGSAWTVHNPVNPAGAVLPNLSSVSCSGRSFCIAVGSYQSGTGQATLAEKWNGRVWTRLAMPGGASTHTGLTGVSCVSSARCVAVGSDNFQPLAESWNGTSWTVMPAPPDFLRAVSCAGAANCIAIGSPAEAGGGLAMSWNGSSWNELRVPPAVPFTLTLSAVSCPAASKCIAVGQSDDDGSFAMSWDGSAWRVLRVNHADELSAISCTLATRCMATGSYVTGSGKLVALTESWNGTSWHRQPASRAAESVLSDVSCTTAARCIAVGAIGDHATLAEAWNGTAWRVTPPAPGNQGFPTGLNLVSCSGLTCLALGTFGLSEAWNGSEWQIIPEHPGNDVSCASPGWCMEVGTACIGDPGDCQPISVAALWNGTNWQPIKLPPGTGLNTVSCTSTSFCMAVGRDTAEIWNGTSWRTRKLPGTFGTAGPGITAVSCARPPACMAVGNYVARVGSRDEAFNVAEIWNGTSWRRLPTAGPGGGLTDVSCTSKSRCMAVGLSPARAAGTNVLAERWNGRRWHLLATPNP